MRTVLASAAVLAGAAFMFIAALGIARLPDLYTRMQAATKASTVGVVAVMCGIAVAYPDASVTIRAILVAGFFLLTSPVAAHAIARSAHLREAELAPGTKVERAADRRQAGGGAARNATEEVRR
jgi:multicomponent Na+:H+ antiporter subunit G